jgi:tetratricopeptide (TPR) repeat protein
VLNLVGRERELEELGAALRKGRGEVFMLVGEAGIGKTTLADALAEAATSAGARVAWGRAWEAGDAPAYHLWAQIARSLGFELPSTPAGAIDPSRSRLVFFEQVVSQLERACTDRRVVLVLDDLHAADAASLLLLSFVVREKRRVPVLVIGTYRDVEARQSAQTYDLLAAVAREGTHVRLGRLSEDDVRKLASAAGLAADEGTLAEVYHITEGHPLFVCEALRLIASRPPRHGGRLVLPDDTTGTIRSRLGMLDEATRAILAPAAVVGREVDRDVLAAITERSVLEIDELVAPAVLAGILDERAEGALRFSHVLLRDELYRALGAAKRAQIHARVAEVLARRGGRSAAQLGEIAHHRTLAATDDGVDVAIDATLAAAHAELAGLAFEDAAARLGRAIAMFAHRVAPARLAELHLQAALAQMRAGRIDEGRAQALVVADMARGAGDHELLTRSALAYGAEITPGRVDPKLVALLEETLAATPDEVTAARALLLGRLAAARQPAPDPRVPIAMAEEAIALARRSGDEPALRGVLHWALSAMASLGHPRVRRPLGEEMLQLCSRAGDRVQVWRCHVRLALDCFELGDLAAAEQHLGAHEHLAVELREERYRIPAILQRALLALYRGDFAAHERFIAESNALTLPPNERVTQAVGRTLHPFMRSVLAEDGPASERHHAALMEFFWTSMPSIGAAPFAAFTTAWMRCYQGDLEAARAALAQDLGPRGEIIRRFVAFSGAVIAAIGTDAERELALEFLADRADTITIADMVGFTLCDQPLRMMGLLHAALGRSDEAIACLERSVALLERTGGQVYLPRVRRDLAEVRARAGAPPAPVDEHPTAEARGDLTLARRGDSFELRWGGQQAFFKATRGMELLAALVLSPDTEILALVLDAGAGAEGLDRGSAGAAIDERAMHEYRARAEDLREALEEATRFGDVGRAEKARRELEQIGDELARSTGLGGRAREEPSAVERARINVQRHLKRAITRIGKELPALGRHLEWAVRTGTYCVYRTR